MFTFMQGWPKLADKYQSYNFINLGDEHTPEVPLTYSPRRSCSVRNLMRGHRPKPI